MSAGPPAPPLMGAPHASLLCLRSHPSPWGWIECLPPEGPSGPAPSKNPGSESVTGFPGDMCLCGSLWVPVCPRDGVLEAGARLPWKPAPPT